MIPSVRKHNSIHGSKEPGFVHIQSGLESLPCSLSSYLHVSSAAELLAFNYLFHSYFLYWSSLAVLSGESFIKQRSPSSGTTPTDFANTDVLNWYVREDMKLERDRKCLKNYWEEVRDDPKLGSGPKMSKSYRQPANAIKDLWFSSVLSFWDQSSLFKATYSLSLTASRNISETERELDCQCVFAYSLAPSQAKWTFSFLKRLSFAPSPKGSVLNCHFEHAMQT